MAKKNVRIAIVEDDSILAHDWLSALAQDGYEVFHCRSIDEALERCNRDWPDLVVLDAFFEKDNGELSNRGGLTFCAELSRIARGLDRVMPVMIGVSGVAVSEYMPRHVFETVSQTLMPVRLKKPFSNDRLIQEIEKLTGETAPA